MKDLKLSRSVKFDMFLTFMLLLGGINYFFIIFKQNMFSIFGRWRIIFYVIIAFAAIKKLKLESFLPFLDYSAFPLDTLSQTYPVDSNAELVLTNLPPNARVIYWAAEGKDDDKTLKGPREAYGEYTNSGVVKTDKDGKVKILLRCPKSYSVGKVFKYKLPQHIHYRYELSPAILSKVYTQEINC